MPSANSRISQLTKQSSDMADTLKKQTPYPDFVLCSRILFLARTTNQLMNSNNARKVNADLECALLQFGITYKT